MFSPVEVQAVQAVRVLALAMYLCFVLWLRSFLSKFHSLRNFKRQVQYLLRIG